MQVVLVVSFVSSCDGDVMMEVLRLLWRRFDRRGVSICFIYGE